MKNRLNLEVLDEKRKEVLNFIFSLPFGNSFYLAGGTGLAVQIGHRNSIDFDLFSSSNQLKFKDRERIKRQLRKFDGLRVIFEEDNILDVSLTDVRISFFYYPYRLVKSFLTSGKIKVASMEDIALMKLAAIISRGSRKDFIDLYFIIREYIPLKNLFRMAKRKYPEVYDFSILALKGLTFFKDAEKEKMPLMFKKVRWKKIKDFFIQETKKIVFNPG
ncbi:MAG: nucleotidyl transferase AbiEii/AbiGii toxin family protein [Elusimicrobia bacterium]|nr:nucleotidyl transferase AbiEii/AbiGii toxin family protein [Elusimicrobiota bacterium]